MMEIGLGTETTRYGKMLDKNIKVNATCEYIQEGRYVMEYYGSLVFDDSSIYDYLINELEKEKKFIMLLVMLLVIIYLYLLQIENTIIIKKLDQLFIINIHLQ